jgi:anaerobic selenocysteine-containing dehydrogenase
MKVTRRDLLVWGAGAAAGIAFTPVPWKILDDVSIWSQNWSWIPQPARGPVEVKQSFCTLCPNGCGLRVRTAAGWPVGIAGMSTHPITRGALCPLAFGAHQLNWHPQRLRAVRHQSSTSSWAAAQAAFSKACSEGTVVVIDGYAGRAASQIFEAFAEKRGSYRVAASPETRALAPYESWSGVPANALGYDLENAQTIVSFGAAMLDGWGAPGRFTRLWAERAAGMADPQLRLIQIDASLTRTATKAWQWISIPEGSEGALAAGVARVLLEEHSVPARAPVSPLTLVDAASQTGLTTDAIRSLARTIVARPPVVAIAADNNPAVAALNVVLGALGQTGGIVLRSKQKKAHESADAVIPKARAVVIDSTVPWDFVPRTDAEIFRFAAWDGGSNKAEWLLPAPGFLEELTDVPTAPTSAVETYAVAPAVAKPTAEVHSAAQFLASFDAELNSTDKIIHARCEEIFRARAGSLYGRETTPVAQVASAQKLEEQLRSGAVWVGEPLKTASLKSNLLKCNLKEWPADTRPERSEDWVAEWPAPVLPPLALKLYQESSLREPPERKTV